MAALGFMFGVVQGEMTAGSIAGGIVFLLLGSFLFVSAFKLSRHWEDEEL